MQHNLCRSSRNVSFNYATSKRRLNEPIPIVIFSVISLGVATYRAAITQVTAMFTRILFINFEISLDISSSMYGPRVIFASCRCKDTVAANSVTNEDTRVGNATSRLMYRQTEQRTRLGSPERPFSFDKEFTPS